MIRLRHKFINNGLGEFNDSAMESPIFELGNEFNFTIAPNRDHKFWRFGIIFSREQNFNYHPENGRYEDKSLKLIELVIGERKNNGWQLPNQVELLSNYVREGRTVYEQSGGYIPGTPVNLYLQYDITRPAISVSCSSEGWRSDYYSILLDGYKYFRIAAWADFTPFEIECGIEIVGISDKQTPGDGESQDTNYWLVDIHSQGYGVGAIEAGSDILYSSYTAQPRLHGKRPVQGDKVLAYIPGSINAIAAVYEISGSTGEVNNVPQKIPLTITDIFKPYINFYSFKDISLLSETLNKDLPLELISLPQKTYQAIMDAAFHFPFIKPSEDELKYLEIIYQNFLAGKEIDTTYSLQELWNDLPDFHPEKMSALLVSGLRNITLWGIALIHPESDLIAKFETVIYAVKRILSTGQDLNKVTISQVKGLHPDLSIDDIRKIFSLMGHFNNFQRGSGRQENGEAWINLNDNQVYEEYRKFKGLNLYLKDYFRSYGFTVQSTSAEKNDEPAMQAKIDLTKADLKRKHQVEFNPVMGVSELANDLANIIKNFQGKEKGQMIGVFGKWGRGKTFLLDELWKKIQLDKEIKHEKIVYQAWKYQETPGSWAYLYELFADEYAGKKKGLRIIRYYWRIIWLNGKRDGWLSLIKFICFTLLSLITAFKLFDLYGAPYLALITPAFILAVSFTWKWFKQDVSTKAIDLVNKYTTRHSYKPAMGIQADIQDELVKLLKAWIPDKQAAKKRVLLVVEDIDRCSEEKIIQNIDALRVMLEEEEICKRLVIVVAVDERILKNAIKNKYEPLYKNVQPLKENKTQQAININELVSEYLDKLFILAIKLGELSTIQRIEYLDELIKQETGASPVNKSKPVSTEQPQNMVPVPVPASAIASKQPGNSETGSNSNVKIDRLANEEKVISDTPQTQNLRVNDGQTGQHSSFEKVSPWEYSFLKEIINSWREATPRRITIFYYRYLLCKNLLINKYTSSNNVWNDEKSIKAIFLLIKKYADFYDPNEVVIEKNRVIDLPPGSNNIEIQVNKFSVTKSRQDYLHLLEILELTIAY